MGVLSSLGAYLILAAGKWWPYCRVRLWISVLDHSRGVLRDVRLGCLFPLIPTLGEGCFFPALLLGAGPAASASLPPGPQGSGAETPSHIVVLGSGSWVRLRSSCGLTGIRSIDIAGRRHAQQVNAPRIGSEHAE